MQEKPKVVHLGHGASHMLDSQKGAVTRPLNTKHEKFILGTFSGSLVLAHLDSSSIPPAILVAYIL